MAKRKISEFQIGQILGVGTVGTIYRATDIKTGQIVALKRLLPIVASDPLIAARFEREMLVLEKLSHPNIVQYFGGGSDQGHLFYAMELVEGGTLKQLLARYGRLTWQETVASGTQICSALQHAHNHGIIHRDIKPANLYIGQEGELKLGDFGIARDLGEADITSTGLTVGSHAYMSPEQICGERTVSGKTDLYGLGCVLFEMLTGQTPFQGDNFAQLFEQHLRKPPPRVREFVADCPEELDALIYQLLEKEPDKRPFNARSVQASMLKISEKYMQDEAAELPAGIAGGKAQLSRRVQRLDVVPTRDVSWSALAGLTLVVIGLIALAWQFSK